MVSITWNSVLYYCLISQQLCVYFFSDIIDVPGAERSDTVPDVIESQPHHPHAPDYIMEGNKKNSSFY